ncbi:glucosyltransferase domain-containing protein [Hyphococcus lacteus]|uniref:Glucosyltransferase domain-containing protein n=1 Tax=Hyphococcus lacteus TaxID=3143536 RepID=A0ABV3Z2E7_9PROT
MLYVTIVGAVAFFIFIAHHPLHNHGFRMPWINSQDQVHHGRWFSVYIFKAINNADMPVLTPLIAVIVNTLTAFTLLKIWNFKLSGLQTFLVGVLFVAYPAFLAPFYYTWSTLIFIVSGFFAVLAVYSLSKIGVLRFFISIALIVMAMATYQPAISFFCVASVAAAIAHVMDRNKTIVETYKIFSFRVFSAVIGTLAYFVSMKLSGAKSHATEYNDLSELPVRVFTVIKKSFAQLYLSQPDFSESLKYLLLAVCISALVFGLMSVRRNMWKILSFLGLFFALVVSAKAMYFLSSNNQFYEYRYNTATVVIYCFAAALIFHYLSGRALQNLFLILISFIALRFVQVDLIRQEILFRGQQHDMAVANRLLQRMESLPGLDASKTYDLVKIGKYSSNFRSKILRSNGKRWDIAGDVHLDNAEISASWTDEDIFILLGSKIKFKYRHYDPDFIQKKEDIRKNHLEGRAPWPSPDSVFIQDDKIVLYLQ